MACIPARVRDLENKNTDFVGQVASVVTSLIGGLTAMGMSGILMTGGVFLAAVLLIPMIIRAFKSGGGGTISLGSGGLSAKVRGSTMANVVKKRKR